MLEAAAPVPSVLASAWARSLTSSVPPGFAVVALEFPQALVKAEGLKLRFGGYISFGVLGFRS